MKLPKLQNSEKYTGLYIFDFGDHTGVGFTAEEVAELLESEKYKNSKVYKIHRAYPDGTLELKGVPAQTFQLEAGMFFYSNSNESSREDFKKLICLADKITPPCRAKVHLSKYDNDKYVAVAPYASVVPYNIVIYPKKHQSCFAETTKDELMDLAGMLQAVLKQLYDLLDDPDYNFVIDSSPVDQSGNRHYHWHIEILPRLSTRAGFEIGSGMNINSIFPETCAENLRKQK